MWVLTGVWWGPGAKINTLVKEVITNTTSFERIASDSAMDLSEPNEALGAYNAGPKADGAAGFPQQRPATLRAASHRLTVHPRFPYDTGESHGCKICPANLCKACPPSLFFFDLPFCTLIE